MSELENILHIAASVRDATEENENTAERVGGLLVSVIQALMKMMPTAQIDANSLNHRRTNDEYIISMTKRLEDGSETPIEIKIPAISDDKAGLLTPALLTEIRSTLSSIERNSTAINAEVVRAQTAEQRLLRKIQGDSGVSDGRREPFVSLGSFSSMESFVEHLDTMHANSAAEYGKYVGSFRAMVSSSLINVVNNTTYIKGDLWIQSIRGNIVLSNGKLSLTSTGFGSYYRSHNADGWSEWQIVNKEAIISISKDEASKAVDTAISSLIGTAPETLDTIQEIAKLIEKDESVAADMVADISKNATDIANEVARATAAEKALSKRIDNIPTGGGTGDIAYGSVTEDKLSFSVKNTLNTAFERATLADTLITNSNRIKPKRGAVNDDGTTYNGTSFCSHIVLAGEGRLLLNDGYFVSKVVLLDKDGAAVDIYGENLNIASFEFDEDTLSWLIEFRKSDNTAFDNDDLEKVIKNVSFNSVAWNENSNLDNYNCTGEYIIRGERKNNDDNMPINNLGNIEARLNVIADTIGKNATQVLTLLNAGGGDGNIYTRTLQDNTWGQWGKLQSNIELGVVVDVDNIIDNGIYSGVLGTETFVLVVINNYAIATQAGYGGYISQLKYSVDLAGVVKVETRRRDAYDSWSDWQGIGEHTAQLEQRIAQLEERITQLESRQ